jgi:hypothetical protein
VIGLDGSDVGLIRIEVCQRKIEAGPEFLFIFKAFLMLAEVGRAYPDHF